MSTQYLNVDAMWANIMGVLHKLEPVQSRNGPCFEVLSLSSAITDVRCNWLFNNIRRAKPSYAAAELLWYLSGHEDAYHLLKHAPSYSKFCRAQGNVMIAEGAYGHRIDQAGGLKSIVEILRHDPFSRQAVMPIWATRDVFAARRVAMREAGHSRDVPCTMCLQFIQRDGLLHCITTMRSNDLWLGLPYDVWCFTSIQKIVAWMLGIKTGIYVHNVGSMHLYKKDLDKIYADAKGAAAIQAVMPEDRARVYIEDDIKALDIASRISGALHYWYKIHRAVKEEVYDIVKDLDKTSFFDELVMLAACDFDPRCRELVDPRLWAETPVKVTEAPNG